jgi:hypothetical protein
MKTIFKTILMLSIIFLDISCKKIIDISTPPNQLTPDKVFSNSNSVIAATANLYTVLGSVDGNFIPSIGTYTDELITINVDATSTEFSNSSLTSINSRVLSVWQNLYSTIYKCNSLIENLQGASAIPDSIKNQSIGEAKFLRAYSHLMLTNIYDDVPLITTTNVTVNALSSKIASKQVYQQIIADLNDAVLLLPSAYTGDGQKIRANKWAAVTLLAKSYLYNGDYTNAEIQATQVITSGQYSILANLNTVFLANSNEAIWQTWNANGYTTINSIPSSGKPSYQIAPSLRNAFETGDKRQINWIKSTTISGTTYSYPYKYKQRTITTGTNAEYTMNLRLAEVYLIRGEARAQLNEINPALADLNVIRNRAGLGNISTSSQSVLLSSIFHERQVELFNEAGSRFFDLKRSGAINSILGGLKPLWKPTASIFPIPQSEELKDPNLTQNAGYNN